jgi:hypothetical protein
MAGRNSLLDRHVGEQGAAALLLTWHLDWAATPFSRGPGFFSKLLGAQSNCHCTPTSGEQAKFYVLLRSVCIGIDTLFWLPQD